MNRAARTLTLPDRLRQPFWLGGMAVAAVVLALVLAWKPWFAAGATIGALVLVMLFTRPLALIGIMLAIGALNLAFITGGANAFFPGLGGLDMNGIRLLGIVSGLLLLIAVDRELQRRALAPDARWYLLFLAFAAATLLYSPARMHGLRLLYKLAYPFVLFVAICGLVRTREQLERLGDGVLIAAGVLVMIVNPLLVMTGGYFIDSSGNLRIEGLGVSQNPFSFYLLAMMLLAFGRFAVRGQLRYLLLGGAFGGWIVLTLTRTTLGALLAGLGGAALYAVIVARNYRALVGALVLGAAVAVPLTPVALERSFGYVPSVAQLWSLLGDPVALYRTISWSGREILWPVVFGAFLENPIIGHGMGASTAVLIQNFPASMGRVVHNEYLRLLTDTGVLGTLLFAVAMLAWWRAVVRAGRTADPLAREYALPAFAGIVAWAVISVADNAFDYYAQFTQYVAFFVAGAVVAARLNASNEDESPTEADHSAPAFERA